jgi:hypothetical protein
MLNVIQQVREPRIGPNVIRARDSDMMTALARRAHPILLPRIMFPCPALPHTCSHVHAYVHGCAELLEKLAAWKNRDKGVSAMT